MNDTTPASTPNPQILWAEDNSQDRMLIRESVDAGSEPTLALVTDGVELLDALEARRPELVVLDLKMPRMGGLEVLRRIRGHPQWTQLPVAIFSSGNRPDEVEACRVLGVQEVIQKPVDFDVFGAAVRHLIASVQPSANPDAGVPGGGPLGLAAHGRSPATDRGH